MTPLPRPSDQLAGCCWLPRFAAKIRLAQTQQLPWSYRLALASSLGIDGYFLRHFQLSPQNVLKAVVRMKNDDDLAQWFRNQPSVTDNTIAAWNQFAPQLGAKGQPGFIIFHLIKWVLYPKALTRPVHSLFEAIDQDEERSSPLAN